MSCRSARTDSSVGCWGRFGTKGQSSLLRRERLSVSETVESESGPLLMLLLSGTMTSNAYIYLKAYDPDSNVYAVPSQISRESVTMM